MCRIAVFNAPAVRLFGKSLPPLTDFLAFLEQRKGGDGNGLAAMFDDGEVRLWKGLPSTHPVELIAEIVEQNREARWFVFHTRKASPGLPVVAEQAHPFQMGEYVLCMNGTEHDLLPMAQTLGLTDTQLVLARIALNHLPPVFLLRYNSNFAGSYKGMAFLVRNHGVDMQLWYDSTAGALLFASEFPEGVRDIVELPADYYWDETKPIPK